jgi:hypothetical protein
MILITTAFGQQTGLGANPPRSALAAQPVDDRVAEIVEWDVCVSERIDALAFVDLDHREQNVLCSYLTLGARDGLLLGSGKDLVCSRGERHRFRRWDLGSGPDARGDLFPSALERKSMVGHQLSGPAIAVAEQPDEQRLCSDVREAALSRLELGPREHAVVRACLRCSLVVRFCDGGKAGAGRPSRAHKCALVDPHLGRTREPLQEGPFA